MQPEVLGYQNEPPKIVEAAVVPQRLTELVSHAQRSVYIKTLHFAPSTELHQALQDADKRGVKLALFADNPYRSPETLMQSIYGDLSDVPGLVDALPDYVKPTYRWAKAWINKLKDTRLKGMGLGEVILREHDKAISIDGIGLVGGVNLEPYSFGLKDFLLEFPQGNAVSGAIETYLQSFIDMKKPENQQVTDDTQLLVESHRLLDWTIYRKACRWVAEEQNSVQLVTPFMPFGRILHNLLLKSKQVPVNLNLSSENDIWYTQPPYKGLFNLALHQMDLPFYRGHNLQIHHAEVPTHAKVLLAGNRTLLGSHNFWAPGIYGLNREMAIATSDQSIVDVVRKAVSAFSTI